MEHEHADALVDFCLRKTSLLSGVAPYDQLSGFGASRFCAEWGLLGLEAEPTQADILAFWIAASNADGVAARWRGCPPNPLFGALERNDENWQSAAFLYDFQEMPEFSGGDGLAKYTAFLISCALGAALLGNLGAVEGALSQLFNCPYGIASCDQKRPPGHAPTKDQLDLIIEHVLPFVASSNQEAGMQIANALLAYARILPDPDAFASLRVSTAPFLLPGESRFLVAALEGEVRRLTIAVIEADGRVERSDAQCSVYSTIVERLLVPVPGDVHAKIVEQLAERQVDVRTLGSKLGLLVVSGAWDIQQVRDRKWPEGIDLSIAFVRWRKVVEEFARSSWLAVGLAVQKVRVTGARVKEFADASNQRPPPPPEAPQLTRARDALNRRFNRVAETTWGDVLQAFAEEVSHQNYAITPKQYVLMTKQVCWLVKRELGETSEVAKRLNEIEAAQRDLVGIINHMCNGYAHDHVETQRDVVLRLWGEHEDKIYRFLRLATSLGVASD